MIHRLPAVLTVRAWDGLMAVGDGPVAADGAWSGEVRENGLHFDLSAVEFAYFDVLARVLLVLDAAVRDGVPARIVLPTALGPDDGTTARQARARGATKAFMQDVGFLDALQPPHWPADAVMVSEPEPHSRAPAEVRPARGSQTPIDNEPPIRRRRIVPFHWVYHRDDADANASEYFSAVVDRLSELGLPGPDARAITYGVLTELVENVGMHASLGQGQAPPPLVAAVLVDDDVFASRHDDLSVAGRIVADSYERDSRGGILHLLVGDSGAGLVPRLAPRLPAVAGHDTSASARDTIMRAFDRWSAPRHAERRQRETHGLWRAARLVGSYQGAIVVHSAGTSAGKVRIGKEVADVENPVATTVFQGTLVETVLRLGGNSSRKPRGPWAVRSSAGHDARFEVVTCAFNPEHGLGDDDRTRLDDAARTVHEDPTAVGVVATIPTRQEGTHLTENAMQTALMRALDAASSIAHPVAVVLVFPDADPRLLDLSVGGINADEERAAGQGDRRRSPILVLGAAGPPLWCGGTKCLRAVLRTLAQAGGALSWDQVRVHWQAAGGNAAVMERKLSEHPQLATATNAEVALRISAADTVRALADSARRQLATRIEDGGQGVEVGYFRIPTLRLMTRWIDAAPLIETTIGSSLAAMLLARHVEEQLRLDPSGTHTEVVARTAMTPAHLAGQFSECLDLGGRFYTMPGELDLDGIPVSEQVPPHASVILCADVISSENTARRAAAAIVSKQAVPVAIACVVDCRAHRGPIRIFNRDIPVLSLVTADVEPRPTQAGGPVDIDPLLRRPLTVNDTQPDRTPIPESTLLAWCAADVNSLRLGHVERMPRMRHFSAYLRIDRLLDNKAIAAELADAVWTTVQDVRRQWRADTKGEADRGAGHLRSSEIWHPGASDDYAGRLARLVRDVLVDDGAEVVGLRSIPRAVAGRRWTFPTSLDESRPVSTVVIVDWGALSSISVEQMMRLAAEAGATAILAVILLDQLEGQDSDALRAISAMRARRSGASSHVVPTEVRFLTRSSIGGLHTPDCSLCEVRDRYEDYSRSAPRALREQALKLREYTRLRSREELFGQPAGDMFNVPMRGRDMADYLRWRELLQRALGVTAARQRVLDHLETLTAEPDADTATEWTGTNLVRLTAAEQQWLKLPPLRFAGARELLAAICVTLLRQSSAQPLWLRVQAVMVMALAQPDQFVDLMPELVVRVADEPVLVHQVLLECHRLVRRPLLDSPVEVADLRAGLIRARDRFETMRREQETDQVIQYLDVLKDLLTVVQHKTSQRPRGPQEAWDRLREDLMRYVETHRMEAEVLRVRDFVEDLPIAPPRSERSKEALSDWDQCRTQLTERALNNLAVLADIIGGDYVSDRLGTENQQRLLAVTRDDDLGRLREVRDRLHDLVRRPWEPADPEWLECRRHLLDDLKWWHRMFMATHLEGDTAAMVVQIVSSAPADPYEHISAMIDAQMVEQVETEDLHPGSVRVFCPGPLLDNVLAHVMENVRHHALPGAVPRVRIVSARRRDHLDIVIENSGTHPGTPSGRGLRSLDEKLRPFGASVTGRRGPGDPWTFTTTVGLALWQGA